VKKNVINIERRKKKERERKMLDIYRGEIRDDYERGKSLIFLLSLTVVMVEKREMKA